MEILKNSGKTLSVFLYGIIADILAAKRNVSVRRVIQTEHELDKRAFSRAVVSDEGDLFLFTASNIDILQRIPFRALIAEADVFER